LTGWNKATAALGEVFRREAWLGLHVGQPSELPAAWFLILPLALNAFVLCPIIMRRALRARGEGGAGAWAGRLGFSVTLAGLLATASAGYLLAVAVQNIKT
jgi:hypothetical protein